MMEISGWTVAVPRGGGGARWRWGWRWRWRAMACRAVAVARSAAGDCGQDRHLVAVGDGGVEAVQEADVLAADVHIDEPAQPAVLGNPTAQLAVAVIQGVEHLADRGTVDGRGGVAVGGGSELRGDLD